MNVKNLRGVATGDDAPPTDISIAGEFLQHSYSAVISTRVPSQEAPDSSLQMGGHYSSISLVK